MPGIVVDLADDRADEAYEQKLARADHERPRLCINCRWHQLDGLIHGCTHPSNMRTSLIDGKLASYHSIHYVRTYDEQADGKPLCGPSGRFHERMKEAA